MRCFKASFLVGASLIVLSHAWVKPLSAQKSPLLVQTLSTIPPEIQSADACMRAFARFLPPHLISNRCASYSKNTHFRSAGYNIISHWNVDCADIKNVFTSLVPAHIPLVVYLLQQGDMNSGMRSTGAGVLKMLGPEALPCIDAALRQPGIKGNYSVSRISARSWR